MRKIIVSIERISRRQKARTRNTKLEWYRALHKGCFPCLPFPINATKNTFKPEKKEMNGRATAWLALIYVETWNELENVYKSKVVSLCVTVTGLFCVRTLLAVQNLEACLTEKPLAQLLLRSQPEVRGACVTMRMHVWRLDENKLNKSGLFPLATPVRDKTTHYYSECCRPSYSNCGEATRLYCWRTLPI